MLAACQSVLLYIINFALDLLQEIREQHTMRLQVEVITAQVNQLADQVCSTVPCPLQATVARPLLLQSLLTEYIPISVLA